MKVNVYLTSTETPSRSQLNEALAAAANSPSQYICGVIMRHDVYGPEIILRFSFIHRQSLVEKVGLQPKLSAFSHFNWLLVAEDLGDENIVFSLPESSHSLDTEWWQKLLQIQINATLERELREIFLGGNDEQRKAIIESTLESYEYEVFGHIAARTFVPDIRTQTA